MKGTCDESFDERFVQSGFETTEFEMFDSYNLDDIISQRPSFFKYLSFDAL